MPAARTIRPAGSSVVGAVTDPNDMEREVTATILASSQMSVEIWDLGARIVEVLVPGRDGNVANVVQRYDAPGDYMSPDHAYLGATIGRYANRIAHGRVVVDELSYQLELNEGAHHLHGGSTGIDQYVWVTTARSANSVAMRHSSPDGDQGFPGTVTVDVVYTLRGLTLEIETKATSDANTIFATTNHAYWNLAGHGTVAEHQITAPATRYVEVDSELIPTELVDVQGSILDLRTPVWLEQIIEHGGADHCLVFDDEHARAELWHPPSGRRLVVTSNQPGLQVYTGQYLPVPFSAMCLEPTNLPNTPNRPEFGSALLRAGDEYRHVATYDFDLDSN